MVNRHPARPCCGVTGALGHNAATVGHEPVDNPVDNLWKTG